jgi:hypothetical protein
LRAIAGKSSHSAATSADALTVVSARTLTRLRGRDLQVAVSSIAVTAALVSDPKYKPGSPAPGHHPCCQR